MRQINVHSSRDYHAHMQLVSPLLHRAHLSLSTAFAFRRRFLRNESEFFSIAQKYIKRSKGEEEIELMHWYLQAFYTREVKKIIQRLHSRRTQPNMVKSVFVKRYIRAELNCLSCKLLKKPQRQNFFKINDIICKWKSSIFQRLS